MTLLTTREALAKAIRAHQTVATGLGEWCCKCSPSEWRPTAHRSTHLADALLASGAVIDAATLADDEVLVERVAQAWAGAAWENRTAMRRRVDVTAGGNWLRALAAALSEPAETREAAR